MKFCKLGPNSWNLA